MIDIKQYTEELYQYLKAFGDHHIAEKQSAYMRNRFPFIGIMKTEQQQHWHAYQELSGKISGDMAVAFCKACMAYPEREMWYIGQNTLIKAKNKLEKDDLVFVKELIVLSDWWDIVDGSASHLVGALCKKFPELRSVVNGWIEHDNFWLRRTAILYQLGYKKDTDENTLYGHILKTCHEKEFFIRKAIGWSLREYSKHNSPSVRAFIEQNAGKLSALSIKEGSKYI